MSKSPEATFRIGRCSASVFVNEVDGESGKRQFRSATLQRSYREDGETKFSSSFGLGNLPAALCTLKPAQHHIESKEIDVTG